MGGGLQKGKAYLRLDDGYLRKLMQGAELRASLHAYEVPRAGKGDQCRSVGQNVTVSPCVAVGSFWARLHAQHM